MLQWFIRFTEFTDANERSAPFRRKSNDFAKKKLRTKKETARISAFTAFVSGHNVQWCLSIGIRQYIYNTDSNLTTTTTDHPAHPRVKLSLISLFIDIITGVTTAPHYYIKHPWLDLSLRHRSVTLQLGCSNWTPSVLNTPTVKKRLYRPDRDRGEWWQWLMQREMDDMSILWRNKDERNFVWPDFVGVEIGCAKWNFLSSAAIDFW